MGGGIPAGTDMVSLTPKLSSPLLPLLVLPKAPADHALQDSTP